MGFFSRFFGRSDSTEKRAADYLPAHFGGFGGGYNDTGVTISESNAMICSAVWSCVSIIAQTISTLPLHVIRRDDGEKDYDHPIARLMSSSAPNAFMTACVFRETLLTNALLWGAGYAAVTRDSLGYPDALYPLRSSDVRPLRRAGQLLYEVRVGSSLYELAPDQVVSLLGWSIDGITPTSPIRAGTQAVALAVAMERFAAKTFGGANTGGILALPKMNDDAMKTFVESWRRNYTGLDNAFKVAVLPEPFKFQPTNLDPEKTQMTESRQNQVLEIARYYKVPAHMLGLMDKGSSFSSIEQQNMMFYQQTIQPWCVKLEQELSLKCLLERERPALEVRFNLDAMLRSSTQERYTSYQTGRQGGWLSINDIRKRESLPSIPGGDEYLQPLNMVPVGEPATDPTAPANQPPASGGTDTPAPISKDGTVEAGVSTDQTLNGAQIAAAIDVLDKLAAKALVDFAAVELLVAVGIPRDKAEQIVSKTLAAPPPQAATPAPADPNAARAVVEDAVRRVLTKERLAIAKAAKKHHGQPEQFRAWADEWYDRHQPLVCRTVAAPFKAAGLAGTEADYAKRHCEQSLAAAVAAFEAGMVDDLVDELDAIRPGEVAHELTQTRGRAA